MKEQCWIYAHKQPFKKKKRKQRARTFLFVGDPCQVRQWLTFCEATHGAELCASVFHLSKLTTGINDSFPDSGSGGKGALNSQQGPGGPLPFWSFSCIMPLTRYSRARESWLFRWKYLGRNVSPSQPRTFPVAAKPNRDHLSSSFPQADHRLRWYEGERGAIPSCGPSPSWEVIRTSFSSPSGPVQLAIFGPSSVSVLQSTCCMKKIFILIPLKTWFFSFFCSFVYLSEAVLSLHCWAQFSSCREQGLLSSCGAWASHCSGFSCCGAGTLGTWAQ